MLGIGIGAMALVIILSAFNGLENLVEGLYSSFDPEIRITPAKGKFIPADSFDYTAVQQTEGVKIVSNSIEESVMLRYGDNQAFAVMKGVDSAFLAMSELPLHIYRGSGSLYGPENTQQMIAGYFVAQNLNVRVGGNRPVNVYAANRKAKGASLQSNAFHTGQIMPGGVFSINTDFDSKYVVVPIEFMQKIIQRPDVYSSIDLELAEGADSEKVRDELQSKLGESFTIKTRYQLNELIYKTNNTEKWVTFLILTFILVIATFNIIGSLTMLILDKKQDIGVLKSMGADQRLLKTIFFKEGFLISVIGGGAGIILGLGAALAQQHLKLIKLQGMLVDAYPIQIQASDILAVFAMVMIIGGIAAVVPPAVVLKKYANTRVDL